MWGPSGRKIRLGAEAMIIRVVPRWREAAAKIGFRFECERAVDLSREQYEALHGGLPGALPHGDRSGTFVIDRVGTTDGPDFSDIGVEYYRFSGS